jgi:magnesium transporter
MSQSPTEEIVKSAVPIPDLSPIDRALEGDGGTLAEALRKFRPADLGRDLSRRSVEEGRRLFEASDGRRAAAMLKSAHPTVAGRLLGGCDVGHAARTLGFLPMDQQVAILSSLEPEDRGRIQDALEPDERKDIERILGYGESAVARLMTPKVFRAPLAATAGEAMAILREKLADIEVAQNCYVVDADRKLVGVVPLRELAVAPPETAVASMMTRDPIAVREETERGDAAEIVQTHDFLSLPVVDASGRLVGAVRVDDLLQAALSTVGTGILNQGGVAGDIAAQVPYFQTPLLRVVRSRITWLVLLFVAETLTGTVLRHFEDELSKVVALAFFIPLLIGTGGNAGSQTVSTIIRALALGEVRLRDIFRVLAKEVSAGMLLGVLLGGIAFGRAMMWGAHTDLAACVGVTVLVVCTWANTVGAIIPIAAQRVGVDPTVISAPLITTLVDASGLFLYLTIARLMIGALHGG